MWRELSDHDIKLSARDAAVVYHKLLQLHLTGYYYTHYYYYTVLLLMLLLLLLLQ